MRTTHRLLAFFVMTFLLIVGAAGCGKKEAKKGDPRGEDRGPRGRDPLGDDWGGEKKSEAEGKKAEKKGADEEGPRAAKKGEEMTSREGEGPDAVTGARPRTARQEPEPLAGILTAGSFDDNLFPEPYRLFVKRMGQANPYVGDLPGKFLGRRLVIAVSNGDGKPVGNARVTVTSAGGGPSVRLTTRTDGTAVFLSSWDQVAPDEDFVVTAAAADGSRPVTQKVPRRAGRWQITLPGVRALLPRQLDLVLVLDTTGSMGDELEYLKSEIRSIAAAVNRQFPAVDQRYGLVVYRDEGMGDEYVTRSFPLTSSLAEFRKNLVAQSAGGGGDYPEAMHRGLEDAVQLSWRDGNTARVLFLVADAPPHTQFADRTMKAVDTLRKKGVVIYPVAASGADEACEFIMRTAALITGGQYLFLTNDSGVGDAHAEPHIPYYHVQRLDRLMVRMIASELSGKRIEAKPAEILRTVGRPINSGRK